MLGGGAEIVSFKRIERIIIEDICFIDGNLIKLEDRIIGHFQEITDRSGILAVGSKVESRQLEETKHADHFFGLVALAVEWIMRHRAVSDLFSQGQKTREHA